METVTQSLAQLLARPVGQADRDRAALLLLDWTGCAVAGRAEPAGRKVSAAFPDESGACSRIGSSSTSPQMAALHNGCLGNVLEMDDVDKRAVLHAAPTVIPAALAMSEHVGASESDFLNAIVIGYEATIRIGRAVGPGHYAFWHNTATCGPFGAAAAACYLLEGSDLVSALGLAGTQAAGLWQTRHEPDSMAKQLHAGHATQVGVQSALLSAQGFQGPRSILEGEQGFFAALCPGADPQDVLFAQNGWLLHETSLKPYPACRHAHPAIDAALQAEDRGGAIIVRTYGDAMKFCDRPDPKSVIEAKFSLQHSVAVALEKGAPALEDFEQDTVEKFGLTRKRIAVVEDDAFNAAYPAHYGASIEIAGHVWTASDALGDPERSMDEDQIKTKARLLMKYGGMTGEAAKVLIGAALDGTLDGFVRALPKEPGTQNA
ncbi:MAG: MmgE/PrpD family protein [Pseudomonadota bacterium]